MANYVTAQKIVLNRNIFGANLTNRDNTITSIDLSNTEFKDGDGNNFYITSNGTPELEGQRMYWCQRDSSNDISKLDDGYFILLRR